MCFIVAPARGVEYAGMGLYELTLLLCFLSVSPVNKLINGTRFLEVRA